jgi:FlaA1/EpsC-like NDP-sugar epimerase/lipopolysaccharide/colanic/teichoic acid biosynthesis glycosyltransferase
MFQIKRIIDIILSIIGIILLIPLLPVISVLIKLDSKGPVFYLTDRVGKDMQRFKMYKFRTMIDSPVDVGQSVCPQYDPRVTTFGRFLRRTKMNELPQFINVLKGEMTLVGPRPEAPDLASLYPEKAKRIFSVSPGLVSPATILGRNEEECYPPGVDTKKYYIESILPAKLELDLEYINYPSLYKDLQYIFIGVRETLIGAISKKHLYDNSSQIYLFCADLSFILFSVTITSYLYFNDLHGKADLVGFLLFSAIIAPLRIGCNIYFGLYSTLIRYISYHEIFGVLKAVSCGSILLVLLTYVIGLKYYSIFNAVIDWTCLLLLLSGLRFGLRIYWEKKRKKTEVRDKRRIFIYGAGDGGYAAYQALNANKCSPYEAVGFIDDAPDKYGKALNGVKVLGNRYHIKALSQLYRVDIILIAEQEVKPEKLAEIVKICHDSDLRCRILPSGNNIYSGGRIYPLVRNLEFSDLLTLKRIHADYSTVKEVIGGKTVLINSSGGSLGLELCRKILHNGCRQLVIVDRYESYLNETVNGLPKNYTTTNVIPVLIDTDKKPMTEDLFKRYRPDIVIQAGMRKYKSIFDVKLEKICRTYYLYTINLAKLAVKHNCQFFVMISSLIADQGGDFIIDSLRKAEVKLSQFFKNAETRLVISRLPDIAENRGGIVALLEEQIINRGTVILPTKKTRCCLITKSSAAEFILQNIVEQNNKSSDECIFNCNAGSTVSLVELSRRLASFHGLNLGTEFEMKYISQSDEALSSAPQII